MVNHRLLVVRLAALVWLLRESGAVAGELELPGGVRLVLGTRFALAYDDNALLGRRGQFLSSIGGRGAQSDVATLLGVDLNASRALGEHDRLDFAGRFQANELREIQALAGYDAVARATLDHALDRRAHLVPEIKIVYHTESDDWTYRLVEPALRASYAFRSGPIVELRYHFIAQDFAHYASGQAQLKNSYANIDVRSHVVELDARLWHSSRLRTNVIADFMASDYGGNLNKNLADYAELTTGTSRVDRGAGVTAALLFSPEWPLVVSLGARAEVNWSNSPAFTFWAAHGLGEVLWKLWGRHALYVQLDVARYDLWREHFDRRYTNTRIDFRSDVAAVYRYQATEDLRFEIAYRRQDALSNDCLDFDPQRDELGLPVYSRSYSCYRRDRLEISMRCEF